MFRNASAFNQNISNWSTSSVASWSMSDFRAGSALTTANTPLALR
jgi:surface protein